LLAAEEKIMSEFKTMAIRLTNAENAFMEAVKEQFCKTDVETRKILEVFKSERIVILDPVTSGFTLSNGIFWDAQVMDNALDL
jgi:hypothetical protein